MKKLLNIGLVILVLLITQNTWAQRNIDSRLDELKTELNLSEEQSTQLEKIFEDQKGKMQELRDQEYDSREDRMNAMKAHRELMHEEIEAILNDEQKAKFKEIQAERRKERPKGRKGGRFGDHHRLQDGQGKAMHDEIKAYKDENIRPVMLVQREKLESKIAAEDKQSIAEIRVEVEKMKAEGKRRFKERIEGKKDGNREEGEWGRGDCPEGGKKGFRGRHGALDEKGNAEHREQIKSLIEKYADDIQPLFEEVVDQEEKWKKDIKAIAEKYLGDDENRKRRFGDMRERHADRIAKMKMGKFLLLDPNAPMENSTQTSLVSTFSVYPNPAVSESTLEYELLENGRVIIELRDTEGNLLKTLENSAKEAGRHQLTINLEEYKSTIYYIVIKDKNGVAKTKNLVRVK